MPLEEKEELKGWIKVAIVSSFLIAIHQKTKKLKIMKTWMYMLTECWKWELQYE